MPGPLLTASGVNPFNPLKFLSKLQHTIGKTLGSVHYLIYTIKRCALSIAYFKTVIKQAMIITMSWQL